jgi:hypothetical protein
MRDENLERDGRQRGMLWIRRSGRRGGGAGPAGEGHAGTHLRFPRQIREGGLVVEICYGYEKSIGGSCNSRSH